MTATFTAACVHSQGLADMDARIAAATRPSPRRRAAWARLAADLPMDRLDAMTSEAGLADLLDLGGQTLVLNPGGGEGCGHGLFAGSKVETSEDSARAGAQKGRIE